jgi:hypothetical protein
MSDSPAGPKPPPLSCQGVRAPPAPPDAPDGWHAAPPDFVGVGAQRSGTTRWFDLIVAHPQVAAPIATRKELHYFDRFYSGAFSASEAAGYGSYFPRPPGLLTGEWSPSYLASPWTPAMLRAAAPDARLLVLLRDPVERYISALARHERVAAATGQPLNAMAPLDAFARGLYHSQLELLLKHFPRSQLLILQYERCSSDPRSELRRTYEFLGLSDTGFLPPLDAYPNRQGEKPELHSESRRALIDAYAEEVGRLLVDHPEIDVGEWPNFASL